jgi:hypothetical protein
MSNFSFGDCVEITCVHLNTTYRFSPKANETFNTDRGGVRVNDDASQVTANGQIMRQLNRVRWMVDGPIAADSISGYEENALELMSASPALGVWQFSYANGAILVGTGSPVGDIQYDSNSGQINLKVSGGGKLEKVIN